MDIRAVRVWLILVDKQQDIYRITIQLLVINETRICLHRNRTINFTEIVDFDLNFTTR